MNLPDVLENVGLVLSGSGLLKIFQIWLAHLQKSDGSFKDRSESARADFDMVIKSARADFDMVIKSTREDFEFIQNQLEKRIKHLEEAEEACQKRNRELEDVVKSQGKRIEWMLLRTPWRDPAEEMPQPT